MKRYLFYAVFALLVLVLVAGCVMQPKSQAPAAQSYGAVVVEKAGAGYVVKVSKDTGAVELDFEGVIPKDAFKTSSENLLLYKVIKGKTIVAVASTKGVLKKGEVMKISQANVKIASVKSTPVSKKIKAEEVESWQDYQNDPNARLLGDSKDKTGYTDSKVNIYDFVRFVKAFGEDGEYNPEFDFTDGSKLPKRAKSDKGEVFYATVQATDNKVDLWDFQVFAYNYGMKVNRAPVIKSVKVGGEDVTEKVKTGETIYEPEGYYEVKVEIKDYDGNKIANENVSVKNFDLNSGNREVTVTITANDNFGGELNKSFTVKLQAVQILWKYESGNGSAANKNIVLLGDNDTANLKGTIYLGEKSWENVSKYNFTVFNGNVAIATSNELTEPASYINAIVKGSGEIDFEVHDANGKVLDSFNAGGLTWHTPGASVITAKINIFTPDDLVHPNPDWSGKGWLTVYYFKKPMPSGCMPLSLTNDTQNATIVSGKLWVNGDEHKYLKVYVTVDRDLKDLTIDKVKFKFDLGSPIGQIEVPIYVYEVVVDPATALKYVDIDGERYYYFAEDEATLTFDLSEIVSDLAPYGEKSTTFVEYALYSKDIAGNTGTSTEVSATSTFNIEGTDTLYFDNKAPRIKGLLNRYLTPNDKVWFEFVNDSGSVFEDANEVSAKITLYLGNEDPANTTINNEAASAGFEEVTGENEWDATITFADWPKLKSIDKTYFCVKATVSDEFGNKSYTNLYCYTTEGSRMYVDTYVNRADVGWDFTGKHIDEDTDPASTYTSWSATGTFDMRPERSGIEKYQFFVKTDKGNFVNATSVAQEPANGEDFHNGVLYTPKISFKDVPYTEGVLATVTFLVWDNENNWTEPAEPFVKKFIVDNLPATIATFDGNALSDESEKVSTITYNSSTVVNDVELEYSTENVYKVKATVYASTTINGHNYWTDPYDAGVIENALLNSTNFVMNLVDDLKLVVEHASAMIKLDMTDYAGNKSTAWINWDDLTTKQRTIFADWDKEKLGDNAGDLAFENDPGFDILNYDPQPFDVEGPNLYENEIPLNAASFVVDDNGIHIVFYATTTSDGADIYMLGDSGWQPTSGASNLYNFALDSLSNATGVKIATITLKNNSTEDKDLEEAGRKLDVTLLSSTDPSNDELKKVATVTFDLFNDLNLDPETDDFAATIDIDVVSGKATLTIEVANLEKLKFLKEATLATDGKYISLWDPEDLTAPVEVYDASELKQIRPFTYQLPLTPEKYSKYKPYYLVAVSAKEVRYVLKGTKNTTTGYYIYETNDTAIEDIEAYVNKVNK